MGRVAPGAAERLVWRMGPLDRPVKNYDPFFVVVETLQNDKGRWVDRVISAPIAIKQAAFDYRDVAIKTGHPGAVVWHASVQQTFNQGENAMADKRVYLVTQKFENMSEEMVTIERLVRAALPSQALRHVVKDTTTVRIADAEDGARLGERRISIENAE